MADIIILKLIRRELSVEDAIKWISEPNSQLFEEFDDFHCTKGEFLSYFLNTIHEEVPIIDSNGDTPVKSKSNGDLLNKLNKSNTFPPVKKSLFGFSSGNMPNSCSTPRINTGPLQALAQGDSNYFSPISPLYKHNNSFSTPKTRNQSSNHKSRFDSNSVCLGDFIVGNKKSSSKKKVPKNISESVGEENESRHKNRGHKQRRINPTCLNQKSVNLNFKRTGNSFNFKEEIVELPVERSVLAEETIKVAMNGSFSNVTTPPRKICSVASDRIEIVPRTNLVSFKEALDVLVQLYVVILENNFVLNVSSELHFLISLIVSKQYNSDCIDGIEILNDSALKIEAFSPEKCTIELLFNSIHNVIYFAVNALEKQSHVLRILDKTTLRLLSDYKNVRFFSATLLADLIRLCDSKNDSIKQPICEESFQSNVCFISDTDNRENFPNDQSFNAFRKQRDLFYEILRIWEKNRSQTGWSFSIALSGKIRSLMMMHTDPVNFIHLARLFRGQLLSTCGKTCEEGVSDNQLAFLSSIPNVNLEKINRLKSRLVTKVTSNGINSSPVFTEQQEFYRDFILNASSFAFIKHLGDSFISEIFELNCSKFSELEDAVEDTADLATRQSFLSTINCLRLLAKFLGFLDSLPYKTDCAYLSESLVSVQIKMRRKCQPNLDLMSILMNSLKNGNLVLTIPWVTKYISMLDQVTLRLPYYEKVFKVLFEIYQKCTSHRFGSIENLMLVRLSLGWLFEQPHFPENMYFEYCTNGVIECGNISNGIENTTTDQLKLVDEYILRFCCPYLNEMKKLLLSNTSNGSNGTVKHITPLTAVQSPNRVAKKRLEAQLEEAFFSGQPVSVRKTVEFVSERVASTCVKHICNAVVPSYKKYAFGEWKSRLERLKPETDKEKESKQYLKLVTAEINSHATECLRKIREICSKEIIKIMKEKIPNSIDSLLSLDVLPQTKEACTSITCKMCSERVDQWIATHVVAGIFIKEFDAELQRFLMNKSKRAKEKIVFKLPESGRDVQHFEDTLSGPHLVDSLRVLYWKVLECPSEVESENVLGILDECVKTITKRCDVNDCILNLLNVMLVDLVLLLVTHNSLIISQEQIQKKFVETWEYYAGDTNSLFKSLICKRNIVLLAQSSDPGRSWRILGEFLAFLIKEKVLDCDSFENQCVGIFKNDLDEVTLKYITSCLDTLVKKYLSNGGSSSKFTLLVNFLSEFYVNLNF